MTAKLVAVCLAVLGLSLVWPAKADATPVDDCVGMMHNELADEPLPALKAGCTCELNYLKAHLMPDNYAFWLKQIAVMGNPKLEPGQRNSGMMQLLSQRNSGIAMSQIADASEQARTACHLEHWGS